MRHILGLLVFVGFVSAAVLVWRSESAPDALRQRVVNLFIVYVVAAGFGARIISVNLWPFSNWNMITRAAPAIDSVPRIVGVTADGREHRIDTRVWSPPGYEEFSTWLYRRVPSSTPDVREAALDFALARANARRERALEGFGPGARILGSRIAPASHYFHRRRWRSPEDVPSEPFEEVRLYWEVFDVAGRMADSTSYTVVPLVFPGQVP